MGRHHQQFIGNVQIGQQRPGFFQDGKVRLAAPQNTDHRLIPPLRARRRPARRSSYSTHENTTPCSPTITAIPCVSILTATLAILSQWVKVTPEQLSPLVISPVQIDPHHPFPI